MQIEPRDGSPFFFSGGDTGCLLIHGFAGAPGEMSILGEKLAEAGHTVAGVRLAGHGTTPRDMLETRWADWYRSVEEGYQELSLKCRQVYVVGQSMGGLLSLYLSRQYPVAGIVTINSPVWVLNRRAAGATIIKVYRKLAVGVADRGPGLGINVPVGYYRFSAGNIPFMCLRSLFQLISTVKKELPAVTSPLLAMQSLKDEVVNPRSARYIHKKAGSSRKELLWLEKGGHVATLGPAREELNARVVGFIDSLIINRESSYERMCFGCGQHNPIGLKLQFTEEEGIYRTEFIPGEYHQSYDGVIHGGIISTVLDEAMGRYLWSKGLFAPTVELNVRFRQAARVGEKLFVEAEITAEDRRLIEMKAKASREDGTVVAEATAKFIKMSQG